MRPAPLQRPRIPLVVAAHGPRSLGVAARFADTWSFSEPGEGSRGAEAAGAIRRMNALLDARAREAGRDPGAIRRSLCCGFAASSSWSSLEAALADVERFEEAGVDEFVFHYAPDAPNDATRAMPRAGVQRETFLGSEGDLRALAAALGLGR